MKSLPIAEIWSRVVAGETISTFEEFNLSNALTAPDDAELRADLIRDQQIVGLLNSLGHCALSEDEFVAKLSRRLRAEPRNGYTNRAGVPAECAGNADIGPSRRFEENSNTTPDETADRWNRGPQPDRQASGNVVPDVPQDGLQLAPDADSRRPWSIRQRLKVVAAIVSALLVGVAICFAFRVRQQTDVALAAKTISNDAFPEISKHSRDAVSTPRKPRLGPPRGRQPKRTNPGRQPEPVNTSAARTIARLNASLDAVWETSPPERLRAEPLKLRSGNASVTFDNGATVELRGPTELQLLSAGEATLRRGRLSIEVPPRAVGFAINTPAGRIIDLGTRFDVDVDTDGTTNIHVLLGRVKVVPHGATGVEDHRQLTAGERLSLAPFAVDRGRFKPKPKSPVRRQNLGGGASVFRGIQIINGQRFEYNSREEFEQLRKQFPQLRDTGERRSPKPATSRRPPRRRMSGRAESKSANTNSVAGKKKPAAKKNLYGIAWHPELQAALVEAARTNKPVMVLRVLGSLSGFM